jgi:hypothetical protein
MADVRTSFTVLEDSGTQAGLPLHKVLEGDAYAAKNALPALIAKSGTDLIYLKVNPSTGALLVDTGAATECLKAKGELAAGSATLALVTGAEISLAVSTGYESIGFIVSCRRDALFQIIQVDNVTETILSEMIVGPGAYTISDELHCLSFTSGATGTQKIKIMAKNFEALSSLRASVTIEQIV